jgi:hypothetical protein
LPDGIYIRGDLFHLVAAVEFGTRTIFGNAIFILLRWLSTFGYGTLAWISPPINIQAVCAKEFIAIRHIQEATI